MPIRRVDSVAFQYAIFNAGTVVILLANCFHSFQFGVALNTNRASDAGSVQECWRRGWSTPHLHLYWTLLDISDIMGTRACTKRISMSTFITDWVVTEFLWYFHIHCIGNIGGAHTQLFTFIIQFEVTNFHSCWVFSGALAFPEITMVSQLIDSFTFVSGSVAVSISQCQSLLN